MQGVGKINMSMIANSTPKVTNMLAWFHIVGIKLGVVDFGNFGVGIYGIDQTRV